MKAEFWQYMRSMAHPIVAALLVCAGQSFGQSNSVATITTTSGLQYKNVQVMHVDPDGLCISSSDKSGSICATKVRFDTLPEQVQKQFGYDPAKADDFKLKQEQAKQNWSDTLKADEIEAKRQEAIREYQYQQEQEALRKAQEEAFKRDLEVAKLKAAQDSAAAAQEQADAQQKQADAAMIRATTPQTIVVRPGY